MSKRRRWLGAPVAAVAAAAGVVTIGGSSAGAAQPGWDSARLRRCRQQPRAVRDPEPHADGLRWQWLGSRHRGVHRPFSQYFDAPLGNWAIGQVRRSCKSTRARSPRSRTSATSTAVTRRRCRTSSRAAKRHPSDKLALIIWDHGAAWLGTALDEQTNHIIALRSCSRRCRRGWQVPESRSSRCSASTHVSWRTPRCSARWPRSPSGSPRRPSISNFGFPAPANPACSACCSFREGDDVIGLLVDARCRAMPAPWSRWSRAGLSEGWRFAALEMKIRQRRRVTAVRRCRGSAPR